MSGPILWIYRPVPLFRQTGRPSRQFRSTNLHKSRHGQGPAASLQRFLKNGSSLRSQKKKDKLRGFVHGIARNACYIDGWWNSPWLKAQVTALRRQTKSPQFGPGDALQESVHYANDSGGRKLVRRSPTPTSPQVLSRLCAEGKLSDACEAIDFMDQQGMEAPVDILSHLLQECTKEKNIVVGRQVHGLICRSGLEVNVFMTHHLIRMYDACGSLLECNQVFSKHPTPDRAAWAAIISAHDSRARADEVVRLYHSMLQSDVKADFSVYMAVLKACGSTAALTTGKLVHWQVTQGGYDSNILIANVLINMYVKCGSMEDAQVVFTGLNAKSLVSWNAMIAGYAQQGDGKHALKLFDEMQIEGMQPDAYTFVSALNASSCEAGLDQGRRIHALIGDSAYNSHVFVTNALMGMYLKCGSLKDARKVFDRLHTKDVVSWNTMIAGYSQIGDGQEAVTLYVQMSHEGFQPDKVTFISILKACGSLLALDQGKLTHARIVSQGLETDRIIGSSLIDMYSKCGHIEESRRLFENLPWRDVATWNALITGYSHQGNGQEALELFSRMQQEGMRPDNVTLVTVLKACSSATALDQGKLEELLGQVVRSGLDSDVFVGTMLVGLYAKCGNLVDSRRVFDKMRHRNVVSWNAMILGYAQMQVGGMALQLYAKMEEEGIAPDERTFAAGLKACGCVASLEKGKEIHARVSETGLDMTDSFIATALIDMYSKCGSMQDAHRVFDALHTRDIVSWNTLIAGYAHQGESRLVFDLFHRMISQGIKPDRLTFLNLLTACSQVGLVNKAHEYFEMMTTGHRVAPG